MSKRIEGESFRVESVGHMVPPVLVALFYQVCEKLLEKVAEYIAGELAKGLFGSGTDPDIRKLIGQAVEAMASIVDGRITQQDIDGAQADINGAIGDICELDMMQNAESQRHLLNLANHSSGRAIDMLQSKGDLGLPGLIQAVTCRFVILAAYRKFGNDPNYPYESARKMMDEGAAAFAQNAVRGMVDFWKSKDDGVTPIHVYPGAGPTWGWSFYDNGEHLSGVGSGATREEALRYATSLRRQRINHYLARQAEIEANVKVPFDEIFQHWATLTAKLQN